MALGFLMNDDIFISYYRNDADLYTIGLDNALTQKGYSCFTDHRGTDAGRVPTETLFRKVQGCKMLILLGTQGAVDSAPVAQEVIRFAEANGTSRIIPVSFDKGEAPMDWQGAGWFEKVEGIKRAREKKEALGAGRPSDDIIERIEKQFGYAKSKDRLRRYRNRALVTLLLLLVASVLAGLYAIDQSVKAVGAKQGADKAIAEANDKIRTAQSKAGQAEALAAEADKKRVDSEKKAADAQHLVELAESAKKDAEKQRRDAEADARKQEVIAKQQRAEADKQTEIARARQLISRGELAKNQGAEPFIRPVQLALEASQHHQSFEPDSLLRYGLDRLPRLIASLPHQGQVQAAAFSPDGRTLSTLSSDSKARVWDVTDGREVSNLSYDPKARVTLSHDGRYLAVYHPEQSSQNQSTEVFDLAGNRKDVVAVLKLDEPVVSVAFSERGEYVAVGGATKGVKVWSIVRAETDAGPNSVAFKETSTVPPNEKSETSALRFSPNGQRLSVISDFMGEDEDGDSVLRHAVSVWEVNPVRKLYSNTGGTNYTLSQEGSYIAYAYRGGFQVDRIRSDGSQETVLDRVEDHPVSDLAFGDDGILASAEGSAVHLYFLENGKEVARLEHDADVSHVSFSGSDQNLYIATITDDQMAHLWAADTRNQKHVRVYETLRIHHKGKVNQIVSSPDSQILATVSDDGTARVWEKMRGGAVVAFHYEDQAWAQAFSSNGRYIAVVTGSETWVWDTSSRQVIRKIAGARRTYDVAVSDDGKYLITGDGSTPVTSWDTSTGEGVSIGPPDSHLLAISSNAQFVATRDNPRLVRLWGDYGRRELNPIPLNADVYRVTFSPGGQLFAVSSEDHMVSVRETVTNKELERFKGVVAFNPDETSFAVGDDDGVVRVLKKNLGEQPATAEVAHLSVPGPMGWLVYSPEGNHLAINCKSGKLLLWINMNKDPLLVEHTSAVSEVAFSRHGHYLAAGFDDGAVQLIRTTDGEKVGDVKYGTTISTFAFTPDERYLAVSTSMHDRQGDPDDDQTIFVWDVDKKETVITMGFPEYIRHIAFDAEGRYLHVISDHQTAQVLWLPQDMVNEARLRLSANLVQ